jgi:hypothetical protein
LALILLDGARESLDAGHPDYNPAYAAAHAREAAKILSCVDGLEGII